MPEYRLYFLGRDGHVASARRFEAAADKEAIHLAGAVKYPLGKELWRDLILIERFTPPIEGDAEALS